MLFIKILDRAEDPHGILDSALAKLTLNGEPVTAVRARLANYRSRLALISYFLVVLSMTIMTFDLLKSVRQGHITVAREFWNVPLLVVSPLLFLYRQRMYFNINHNLSSLPGRFPLSIFFLARLGFRFILFDGHTAVATFSSAIRSQFITPLFPVSVESVSTEPPPRHSNKKWTVGLVGDFRSEKGDTGEFVKVMGRIAEIPDTDLLIGLRKPTPWIQDSGLVVNVIGTESRVEYLTFLRTIDVLILFARKDRYYCRHSGTIMDAVACYAIPVVPNFPVLASQITLPVQVGLAYDGLEEIVSTIANARQNHCMFRENIPQYLRGRTAIELCGNPIHAGEARE